MTRDDVILWLLALGGGLAGLVNAVDEQKLLPVLGDDGCPLLSEDGNPFVEMQPTGRQLLTVNQSVRAVKAIGALERAMLGLRLLKDI